MARIAELKDRPVANATPRQPVVTDHHEQVVGGPSAVDGQATRSWSAIIGQPIAEDRRAVARAASSDEILLELDSVALSDIGQAFDLSSSSLRLLPMAQWPPGFRRAVSSVKVREYPLKTPEVSEDDLELLRAFADELEGANGDGVPAGTRENRVRVGRLIRALANAVWRRESIAEIRLWSKPQALQLAGNARDLFKDLEKLSPAELARLEDQLIAKALERRKLALLKSRTVAQS